MDSGHKKQAEENHKDVAGKEAIEMGLSRGSRTFEAALLQLVKSGLVTQDAALANADSATNLLWLLINGPDSNNAPVEA